jgi:hypothetical protein
MRRYSAKLRVAGNQPVEARVGVNTGEVVVRSITTGQGNVEYAPIGHATGLAARMQALAPTGSIAATDAVRKLCEGYFTFKTLGPTKVKGVTEPVDVYEVPGFGPLRAGAERGHPAQLADPGDRSRACDLIAVEKGQSLRHRVGRCASTIDKLRSVQGARRS